MNLEAVAQRLEIDSITAYKTLTSYSNSQCIMYYSEETVATTQD